MSKSRDAFRTISEVAELLDTPAHVLRFWESKFTQVKPVKRAGGRRYYRPGDIGLLAGIKKLLHDDGLTIKGVQKVLREQGVKHVAGLAPLPLDADADMPEPIEDAPYTEAEPESGTILPFAPVEPSPEPAPEPVAETIEANPPIGTEPAEQPLAGEAPTEPEPIAEASPDLPETLEPETAETLAPDADAPEIALDLAEAPAPDAEETSDIWQAPEPAEMEITALEEAATAPEAPEETPAETDHQPDLFGTEAAPEEASETAEAPLPDFLSFSLDERAAMPESGAETAPGPEPEAMIAPESDSLSDPADPAPEPDPRPDLPPEPLDAEGSEAAAAPVPAPIPPVPSLDDLPPPRPGALAYLARIERLTPAQTQALAPHLAALRQWIDTHGKGRRL
ncbi:MerR family transcriptional regulator [Salipiger sp. P9]|uniref:MerR family transcriptional regulator n=1 Tax=Salipiger pentaromativorans TaxID=2943193 RepID=UPI0021584177|nr:MerR family transcriptional regulator [Salipiger pentaromativorans]MCR8547116.1 MerR family transcriptional regulator [Salipiger pentaromativorans]